MATAVNPKPRGVQTAKITTIGASGLLLRRESAEGAETVEGAEIAERSGQRRGAEVQRIFEVF